MLTVYSIAMRMIRMIITARLTERKMARAPQRIGESLEGTLGLGGPPLGTAGFSPGRASSTPSAGGGGLCPGFSVVSLMKGLTRDGTVFLRSEGKRKSERIVSAGYLTLHIALVYVHSYSWCAIIRCACVCITNMINNIFL